MIGNMTGNMIRSMIRNKTGNTSNGHTEVSRTEKIDSGVQSAQDQTAKQTARDQTAKQAAREQTPKQSARSAGNAKTDVKAPESRFKRVDGQDGQIDCKAHRRAEKGGFSRQSGMYYAEYVDHMLRHYSRTRNSDGDELNGCVDAKNWASCRDALSKWAETDRTVIIRVFCTVKSRTDDAVRAVAEEMRMPYGQVFALVRRARKEIARERGLID